MQPETILDRVIVQGKQQPTPIYEVLDGETELVREMKLQTQQDFEPGLEHYRRQSIARF